MNEGASDSVCVVVSGSLESQLSVHVSTTEDTAKGEKKLIGSVHVCVCVCLHVLLCVLCQLMLIL